MLKFVYHSSLFFIFINSYTYMVSFHFYFILSETRVLLILHQNYLSALNDISSTFSYVSYKNLTLLLSKQDTCT